MSWSMIDFKNAWAHAHDWEQVLFMSLAPEVLGKSDRFSATKWLQEWKEYWIEHKETHVNGCSNIDLERFLISSEKIDEFIDFTFEYDDYARGFGDEIPADELNARINLKGMFLIKPCGVSELLDFTNKVRAVIKNDFAHDKVSAKST